MKKTLTISALARAVKRDAGTVSRWTKRDDWPFGPPKWPASIAPKVLKWMTRLDSTGGNWIPPAAGSAIDSLELPRRGDREDERRLKMLILEERGKLLRLERQKIEGDTLDREDTMREIIARETVIANGVRSVMNIAPLLIGLNEIDTRQALEKWARNLCRELQRGDHGEDAPACPTPAADSPAADSPAPVETGRPIPRSEWPITHALAGEKV